MARKGGRVMKRRATVELFEQMRREYEHGEHNTLCCLTGWAKSS
jgi:hypothetical protein